MGLTEHLCGIDVKLICYHTRESAEKKDKNIDVAVEERVGANKKNRCYMRSDQSNNAMRGGRMYIETQLDSTWQEQPVSRCMSAFMYLLSLTVDWTLYIFWQTANE